MQCRIFRDPGRNRLVDSDPEHIETLGKYHPWCDGHNPNFDKFSRRILDVKDQRIGGINYYTNQLRSILSDTEEYVICVMPTHALGTAPSGIRTIAKRLCSHPIIDGTEVLSRVFEIPQKTRGGRRDWELEIKSLIVRNEGIVKGRQVLLMDDVTTTGTSLKAGRYVIKQAGAKLVALLALGKTQK